YNLVEKYKIKIKQDKNNSFLDKWFLFPVREEIDFVFKELKKVDNKDIKKILAIILSRTVRSCRATTHADLATLKEPVTTTYYCKKHGKICKPIFSIKGWWQRYTIDTLNRFKEFDRLRTETFQICLTGDSRTMNIYEEIKKRNSEFAEILLKQKIKGIFSSPPYVGLIDYHEQHAYAYEIFGFERKDELEIGPLSKGQGKEARDTYVKDIAESLRNCREYLQKNYDIFLVANDKFNLYPDIARLAEMKIVNRFKRPVLNRVEKDRSNAYAEIIFHLKER
ncbi:MAG: restriction endonuclease subunit M, partial [bacterium (Candidatus Stahlbacteria) CG08_land_8_20_14_0_20_40_26]